MFQLLLLWVGTLAFLTTVGTIAASVLFDVTGGVRHTVDAIGGFTAALLWGAFAFGTTNVEVVSSGVVLRGEEPFLTYLSLGFVGLSLLIALVGTTSLVNVTDVRLSQS